jgi:ABC-type multidrug transport system ATPase subunit
LKRLCNKILFLDKGKQIAFGPTDEIILLYQQMFAAEIEARKKLRLAKRKERIARRNNNLKN